MSKFSRRAFLAGALAVLAAVLPPNLSWSARFIPGDGTGTDRLANITAIAAPGATGTIAIWLRPHFNSAADTHTHVFWDYDNTGVDTISFQRFSHNIYVGWQDAGDQRIVIADTGLFVANTWAHHVFSWNQATPTQNYYINNVSKGSSAAAFTNGVPTRITIGNYGPLTNPNNSDAFADLAEFCSWSVVLTANERAALSAGVNCRYIRPASLLMYAPIWGNASPEPDLSGAAHNLTITGTANQSNHAPVTTWTKK